MSEWFYRFFFGIYPYLCVTVLLLGSFIRFERAQYTWRSGSSELLAHRSLVIGSNIFHIGVLALVFGHFFGMFTPVPWYTRLGVTVEDHAILEVGAGGTFGAVCFIGVSILFWRRLVNPAVRRTSSAWDILVLALVWVQLAVGMATVPLSWADHVSGATLLHASQWAQRLAAFSPDSWEAVVGIPTVYQAHIILGLTIFALAPFTRLVHIWSAPYFYLWRRYQIVREPFRKGQAARI